MVEQNNEFLLKNHQSRPIGSISLPKANVTSVQTLGHGQGQGRGYGRGRGRGYGCDRGRGKPHCSHRSGSQVKRTTQTTKSEIIQRHNLKRG